ncbi:MAG: hypothetical protein M0Z43_02970 [Acidithiobacillus sp.]|nr:hypothetical protein [Acidithiobacillus sp.]
MKRKGAQPHNTNAKAHGVYSAHFTDDELRRIIEQINDPTSGIDAATQATYVLLDRIIARVSTKAGIDEEIFLKLVAAHNETTGRIAALARSRQVVSSDAAQSLTGNIAAALDSLAELLHVEV